MRVVVVGGGFGGSALAYEAARHCPDGAEIVVIGADNHMVFTPLLPEVAGRAVSPLHVVVPGRELVRKARWITARVTRLDTERNEIHYSQRHGGDGVISFDHAVLACGQSVNLDAVPGMSARSLPLKSVGDAIRMGNEVIGRFEEASASSDPEHRQQLLSIAVIGGGFSGVEIAGHLFDLMTSALNQYPQLAGMKPQLVVLQRGGRVLPELEHESLSTFALRKMRERGIEVRLNAAVKEITEDAVVLEGGERVRAGLVISTVGTSPHAWLLQSGLPVERGRVKTDADMRVTGTKNIWALGDCAIVPNAQTGKPSSATAQFALRQARQMARNIGRACKGEATKPFRYRPQGLLASIGHQNGVAEVYGIQFSGMIAWFFWRGVYLWKMPTLSRRIQIAVDWAWAILFPPSVVEIPLEPASTAHLQSAGRESAKVGG
jgi:NADH:ubiquinone reductase (H+-translocating)